jgi:long-chain acyl-CoA synthetase
MSRPPLGTLTELFFRAAEQYDKPDALQYKADGAYRPISHHTLVERVRRVGLGLCALGIRRGDRVAILSENRPEWAIADYACLTAGLIDVPLYATLPAEHLIPMLVDSEAVAVFVSTPEQAAKIALIRDRVPTVRHVIGLAAERLDGASLTFAELEASGAGADSVDRAAQYRSAALSTRPDDLATIIYTSGTSGEPKGVMLSHDNIHSNVAAAATVLPFEGRDVCLSFLPLSHIFERMAGHYLMYSVGASIAYAESLDALLANFAEVRPTFVMSVPRVYEKVYGAALHRALTGGTLTKSIFLWARRAGRDWAEAKLAGREPSRLLALRHAVADRLVFSKLRARMGGRLRYFVSGGAPLATEINKFFFAAGLVILEGYGLTETSPVIAVNVPEHFRIGTVGWPLTGVEIGIADDGEILCRGPNVMLGYYKDPEATRAAVDAEGWFHTGDIGELRDGFLTITDRKKDIIVTAGGKNIAPQPIENRVRTSRFVSQAVMIGDGRKFPALLVVPNFDALEHWAAARGLAWRDRNELVANSAVRAHVEYEVFAQLKGLAGYETPKKIAILAEDFSLALGEITPKLNVKRRVIARVHTDVIDNLYRDGDQGA